MERSTAHSCPFCSSNGINHIHDKQFERRIKELPVLCPNKSYGCEWTGSLVNLKDHLHKDSGTACQHMLVNCPLECGNLYKVKDLSDHMAMKCSCRAVTCEHCGVSTASHLMEEHYSLCERFPVVCPSGCERLVRRSDLEDHQRRECVNRRVACLFSSVGCEVQLRQEEYEQHLQECKEKHLVRAHKKMLAEVQALKDDLLKLKEENQFLHSKIASLHAGLVVCHDNTESLRQENTQLKSVLMSEMSFLHSRSDPRQVLSVDCLKTQLRGRVVLLTPGGEPATFRITSCSFSQQHHDVWSSPPFYLTQGCKFCFVVHLNGVGAGERTHVAMCLHQVVGEFDTDLHWPVLLEEDLEVRLMRQDHKDGKKSFLKSGFRTPPAPRRASEARGQTQSLLSLETPYNSSSGFCNTLSPETRAQKNFVERQIMSISQALNRPSDFISSAQPIAKLELFCLQKTFKEAVFLDSAVLQCKLLINQGSPVLLHDKRKVDTWKQWNEKI